MVFPVCFPGCFSARLTHFQLCMQLHFSSALYFLLHSLCCPQRGTKKSQQKKTFVSNRKTLFIYQNSVHFFCFSFWVLWHTAAWSKTGLTDKSCLVWCQRLRIRSVGVFWQRPVSLCCSCCCSIACCSQLTPSENQKTGIMYRYKHV